MRIVAWCEYINLDHEAYQVLHVSTTVPGSPVLSRRFIHEWRHLSHVSHATVEGRINNFLVFKQGNSKPFPESDSE